MKGLLHNPYSGLQLALLLPEFPTGCASFWMSGQTGLPGTWWWLEQHYGADSGSTVLSEVGRHVAGGTLFLWENESRGISFSIILMSNMDTEKAQ